MYKAILLIMAAAIVFLGVRIVMKIREISSYEGDEEEHASALKARLPKDLQSLKLEESNIEDWDTANTTDKKVRGNEGPPEKPQ
jgi:hypothetical protein